MVLVSSVRVTRSLAGMAFLQVAVAGCASNQNSNGSADDSGIGGSDSSTGGDDSSTGGSDSSTGSEETGSDGTTGNPGDAGTTSADARTDAPSCSSSLASRLTYVDVATSTPLLGSSLAILAPKPGGGSVVGWWGSDDAGAGVGPHVHITPLGTDNHRAGSDLVLNDRPTNWFASVVADDTSVSALAFNRTDWWPKAPDAGSTPNDIFLARWDNTGSLVLDDHLGYDYSGFFHAGKVAYSQGRYATYYPINNSADISGDHGHEGDTLAFYDQHGKQLSGGWGWNCSHSGDQRLFMDGTKVGAVCDSDAYPSQGILFAMNGNVIHPQPDATGGFGQDELGELLGSTTGYYLIFATGIDSVDAGTATTRPGGRHDVLLVALDDNGKVTSQSWVTTTTAAETQPHVAQYGKNLFVMYGTVVKDDAGANTVSFRAEVLSPSWNVVTPLESLDVAIAPRDLIVTYSNGDVGWAAPGPNGGLRVYRLALCQ
jgi:hypothetical protein